MKRDTREQQQLLLGKVGLAGSEFERFLDRGIIMYHR